MNILYGVPGEGMGHATRSKVVIDHLLKKGHELYVFPVEELINFWQRNFQEK